MNDVKLFQGDCLELMRDIPDGSVDCVITDPPYGTTDAKWDMKVSPQLLFNQLFRVLKIDGACIIFSQMPFSVEVINACRKYFRYEVIWIKSVATGFLNSKKMPLKKHENILVFYRKLPTFNPQKIKGAPYTRPANGCSELYSLQKKGIKTISDGYRYPVDVVSFKSERGFHSTQKPVVLLSWLVKTYTNPGDTVLDCFMGSGTTGVACVRNNRKFIGIELQEKYYEIARNRIAAEQVNTGMPNKVPPFLNLSPGEFNVGGFYSR